MTQKIQTVKTKSVKLEETHLLNLRQLALLGMRAACEQLPVDQYRQYAETAMAGATALDALSEQLDSK